MTEKRPKAAASRLFFALWPDDPLRESLRQKEQDQIDILARRLEADLASLSLEERNSAESVSLETGNELLSQLRNTEAVGRLVIDLDAVAAKVGEDKLIDDIELRDGDTLLVAADRLALDADLGAEGGVQEACSIRIVDCLLAVGRVALPVGCLDGEEGQVEQLGTGLEQLRVCYRHQRGFTLPLGQSDTEIRTYAGGFARGKGYTGDHLISTNASSRIWRSQASSSSWNLRLCR
mgnify:CR=1 FL=1